MTLARYLLVCFLKALIAVQAVIALIVVLAAGVENLRRFSDSPAGSVLRVTALQAPEVLYQASPLVLMLASLVTFLRLARTSELVVMRASGVSALRLIAVPAVAAVVLACLMVAAVNPIVAASIQRGADMQDALRGRDPSRLSVSKDGLWLRQADPDGQTVIQAARTNADGTALTEARFTRFDADGRLYARVEAGSARLEAGDWALEDALLWQRTPDGRFDPAPLEGGRLALPTTLTREQIVESFSPPETVSFWELGRFIGQVEEAGFSGRRHRLFLQSELAKPALYFAMVLIGAAFALRPARFGQVGVMMLLAVLAGFSLYFLKDFAESLGASGALPLMVAAWTPPVAAILLALGLLLHLEDG
ncbi:LPS export ABC transporter permease LptG [Amaricoccus sp.]|uniref:LPS export ABC transporter permease LptG n=1 Tax=Amaricoccus sp. TaxID=1872485 RepID=UPI001B7852A6|nr:LPS export ABC transporter permease LptG [Amaricoccus sp.]MBP7002846.1 LPS export ABC transporter permease LptG [Amaricoccus sp.]